MQPSNGGSRIKLNRNAFKLQQGSVAKRRRLSMSSGSECSDPVVDVHATGSEESTARAGSAPCVPARAPLGPQEVQQHEPSRMTEYDLGVSVLEPTRAPCTLKGSRNNNNNNNYNSASRRKQIRCHVHLALRFCGEKSSRRHGEAEQSVSCTVSRYIKGNVRVQTSSSIGDTIEDTIEPYAGSAEKPVANHGVKTDKIRLEAHEKKDGRDGLRPSKNRLKHFFLINDVCFLTFSSTLMHKAKFTLLLEWYHQWYMFCIYYLGQCHVV